MVVYYSYTGNTKLYAEILSALTNETLYEIKETKPRAGTIGFITGAVQAALGLSVEINDFADLQKGRAIYICSPTWAGGLAPAVKTFLKNTDLSGKKVNVVLTCSDITNHKSYEKKVSDFLASGRRSPGFIKVFTTDKRFKPDSETIRKHLKKLVLNLDESF